MSGVGQMSDHSYVVSGLALSRPVDECATAARLDTVTGQSLDPRLHIAHNGSG